MSKHRAFLSREHIAARASVGVALVSAAITLFLPAPWPRVGVVVAIAAALAWIALSVRWRRQDKQDAARRELALRRAAAEQAHRHHEDGVQIAELFTRRTAQAQACIAGLRNDLGLAERAVAGWKSEAERLVFRLQRTISDRDTYRAQVSAQLSDIDWLGSDNDRLVSENERISAEVDRLRAENQRLSSDEQGLVAENVRLASGMAEMMRDLGRLAGDKSGMVADNAEMQTLTAQLVAENARLTGDNVRLSRDVEQLRAEIAQAHDLAGVLNDQLALRRTSARSGAPRGLATVIRLDRAV